ncbi:hypothetical protein [Niveibacterium sp. SC-1]|uniref:hypothetical protein n=1 Tax=Niveibacterium sp. SC-1 TaxID=3135646 RepID=UPI003120125F
MIPPLPESTAAILTNYPAAAQRLLLELRALIFETAAGLPEVGALQESVRWGEVSFLTPSGAGSLLRIGWRPREPRMVALFLHCQTSLLARFRARFGETLRYEGERAVLLAVDEALPHAALAWCIAQALTYHRDRASRRAQPARR